MAILAGVTANDQLAQTIPPAPTPVDRTASGDSPDDPGPLSTGLSLAITHAAMRRAAGKVTDWRLARAEKYLTSSEPMPPCTTAC